MKLFVKILGGFLYGILLIFQWSVLLGGVGGSIYGIYWTWKTYQQALDHKLGLTMLFAIGLFAMLGFLYLYLDERVNPTQSRFSVLPPAYRPPEPSKKEDKPRPPILP